MRGPKVDDLHHHLILSWIWDMRDYIDCPPVLVPPPFSKKWSLWVSSERMDTKNTNKISQPTFAHRCGRLTQFWPTDYEREGYIELLRNILKRRIVHSPSAWWLDFGQSPRSLQSHPEPCGLSTCFRKVEQPDGRSLDSWWFVEPPY